jgi:thermitase
MNMFRHAFAVAGLALAGLAVAQSADYVPGELIIKFVPGQSGLLNAPIGATVKGYNAAIGVTTVRLPASMSMSQGLAYYRSKPGVSYADPNYIARATYIPNDPRFNQQYAPQKIQCVNAWNVMRGDPAVKIAILDTGVDYNHEDLAGKCLPGKDFVNGDDDPMDGNGHGTHCAGNAAGMTNNGIGIAGIAPNCSIIPVKVLSDGGSGSYDGIVNGMTWAADNGAHVLSMSLGGGGPVQAVQDACRYAIGKGAIVIAAAGNNGSTAPFYPAYYPEFLAVASTDQNDNRSGFSNYGDWVDVAAPGTNILSTFPGNSYGGSSGTSMACPVVAGLAGLIKGAWLVATPAQIRAQIENNCDPVGNFVIKGRVNAFRSIPTQVTTDPYSLAPSAIELFEGKQAYNTVSYVATSDNRYYAISSKLIDRLGHVATAKATFTSAVNPGTLSQISFKIEASAANYVTGSFFIWNNQTAKYDYVGAWPLTGVDSVKTFTMATPYSRYFNANRQCVVLVRSIMPISSTRAAVQYALRLDQVQLNARKPR